MAGASACWNAGAERVKDAKGYRKDRMNGSKVNGFLIVWSITQMPLTVDHINASYHLYHSHRIVKCNKQEWRLK